MFILFPLGRQTKLATTPYTTYLLIAVTCLSFFGTWPAQLRYLQARFPWSPFNQTAQKMTDYLLDPSVPVSREIRQTLEKEQKQKLYPTVAADESFERAGHQILEGQMVPM